MDWTSILFSFSGRINRAKYWAATLVVTAIIVIAIAIAVSVDATPAWILILIVFVGAVYVGLAVATKRLHDRDKSAWWLVVFYLVPGILQSLGNVAGDAGIIFNLIGFAISIWALVELGFLRGTAGPNRYGPDPLASVVPQTTDPARTSP